MSDGNSLHTRITSKQRLVRNTCAAIVALSLLPLVAPDRANAARPACVRGRVNRTYRGSDGRLQRCVRVFENGRTAYRWQINVTPATTTPRTSSGGSGSTCVIGGWTHDSALYWENILNAKTLGQAAGKFAFTEAVKTLSFYDPPKLIVTGYFEFTFETSDGTIMTGYGEHTANSGISIGTDSMIIGEVAQDELTLTMSLDGVFLPPQRVPSPTLRKGQRIPYQCNGDVLRLTEGGAGGVQVQTQYQRYRRS